MDSGMIRKLVAGILTGVMLVAPCDTLSAQKKGKAVTKTTATKGTSAKDAASQKGQQKKAAPRTESVNDVKRQQGDVQKEIASTRARIKENEQAVKKGLAELTTLQSEIAERKKKLDDASRQVKDLTEKICTVEKNISKEEGELKKLRDEYLKAVKKMRVKRKSASTLSFIFSSKNFSEAMRRMRYLKEFSRWRANQSDKIRAKVAELKEQKELLARTKTAKDAALREESRLQERLQGQYKEQDAMVVKLKANGDALRTYLAQKQAEANVLKNRVSALIAEEQRRAEAERKAREEAARKEEERRRQQLAREEAARKEAEAKAAREKELAAAEKAKKEKALSEADAKKRAKAEADAKKKAEAERKKEAAAKEKAENKRKKEEQKRNDKDNKESSSRYAEARKRQPRGKQDEVKNAPSATSSKGENVEKPSVQAGKASASASAGFAQMKGCLPRPVAGSFRITSRFGRHALPDLPNVMYDNPGIDAEVAAGASAQSVYAGKVSGVYVVPGYSTVVIVNHGSYYTVYGNIKNASVKVGDTVKQGQNLGNLAPGDEDPYHSSIHFEIWHNRDKMNPAEWIR